MRSTMRLPRMPSTCPGMVMPLAPGKGERCRAGRAQAQQQVAAMRYPQRGGQLVRDVRLSVYNHVKDAGGCLVTGAVHACVYHAGGPQREQFAGHVVGSGRCHTHIVRHRRLGPVHGLVAGAGIGNRLHAVGAAACHGWLVVHDGDTELALHLQSHGCECVSRQDGR